MFCFSRHATHRKSCGTHAMNSSTTSPTRTFGGTLPGEGAGSRQSVPLDQIVIAEGIQQRATGLDQATVSEYADVLRGSDAWPFPPVVVFAGDEQRYILADGFHRYAAARQTECQSIPADVMSGTERDALLFAVGANADHGLRRKNEDKRRAITSMLEHPSFGISSDSWIAQKCRVSNHLVAKVRAELKGSLGKFQVETKTKRQGKDGRVIDTSRIGNSRTAPADAPLGNSQVEPEADCGEPSDASLGKFQVNAPAPTPTRRKPGDPSPAVAAQQSMLDAGTALRAIDRQRDIIERNPETAPQLVKAVKALLVWLEPLVESMEGTSHG